MANNVKDTEKLHEVDLMSLSLPQLNQLKAQLDQVSPNKERVHVVRRFG